MSLTIALVAAAAAVLVVYVALRLQRRRLQREALTAQPFDSWSAAIPIGLFRATPKGECLVVNAHCLEITGLSPDETHKNGWGSLVHPDDAPRVREEWAKAAEAKARFLSEYRLLLPGGEQRRVVTEASPVWDEKGKLLEYVGTSQDVSELRRAEAMEAALGRILDQSPYEIFIYDLEMNSFVYANRAALENLKYGMEELCNLSVVDLDPQYVPERFETLMSDLAGAGPIRVEGPTLHRRSDGTSYHTEVYLQSAEYHSRPVVVATVLDITKRVEAELEVRSLEAQVRRKDRLESLGTMASGVAHEINNPIQGAMCYAELLHSDLEKGSAAKEHAAEIIHEVDRVAEIVRKLLRFARQEAEPKQLNRISDLVEDSVSLLRSLLRRESIQLDFDLPFDVPGVFCHGQQIQQVLMTLITNSRDALNMRYPEEHEDKRIRIEARGEEGENGSWVRITVEDHGTGIPPGIIDQVFDPFFTTKGRSASGDIAGAGLGLSVAHGIIAEHGGQLSVESELGAYTRFHLRLPASSPRGLVDG